jgi:hypothetical protein
MARVVEEAELRPVHAGKSKAKSGKKKGKALRAGL